MSFHYLQNPIDMNYNLGINRGINSLTSPISTGSSVSVFDTKSFNTQYTQGSGGSSRAPQTDEAKFGITVKNINKVKGKKINAFNVKCLDLNQDGKISAREIIMVMPLIAGNDSAVKDFRQKFMSKTKIPTIDLKTQYSVQELAEKLGNDSFEPIGLLEKAFGYTEDDYSDVNIEDVVSGEITPSKVNMYIGKRPNDAPVKAMDLLKILSWCENVKLPEGVDNLQNAIPADFNMPKGDFMDTVGNFITEDGFDLEGFLAHYNEQKAQAEDKPDTEPTHQQEAESTQEEPEESEPEATGKKEYVIKQKTMPPQSIRRPRGRAITGEAYVQYDQFKPEYFDVNENERIDGIELLGFNDAEITAAVKANPTFSMTYKEFSAMCGGKIPLANSKNTQEQEAYKEFKGKLLKKIASTPPQKTETNSGDMPIEERTAKLLNIKETQVLTRENFAGLDVNNDGWIEAAELALAGIDVANKTNRIGNMVELQGIVLDNKDGISLNTFYSSHTRDSATINNGRKARTRF